MSKVLKTVGAVASIAALIPGPQQPFVAALAMAANIGAQLTAKPPAARGQVNDMILGANRPMPYLMGYSYSGGLQVHDVGYGGTVDEVENPYRFMPVVYSCCGPVESLVAVQFDFADVTFAGTAASGYYSGYLWRDFQLGLRPEADALAPNVGGAPGWGAGHKLSSWAAIGFSFKWDKKSKRFAGGQLPTIGAVWEGVWVYDPRLDTTYPGGSGSHRINDETTWEYSRNPALHALAYSYGRTVNGVKVFGVDLGSAAIDVASVVAWANVCDANGWNVDGTIFEPGDKWNNLKRICEAGGGQPVLSGGMLRFDYQAPRSPLASIGRDDLAQGAVSGKIGRGFKNRHNTIVPRYRSPDHQWTYQQADAVSDAAFVTADGEVKSDERQWDLVTDVDQVTELAIYDLWQRREAGPFRITCKSHMRIYAPGDCVTLSSDLGVHPGGSVKAVIRQRTIDPGTGSVSFELEQETDDKHTAALGASGTAPGTITPPTSEDLDDAHFDNSNTPVTEVADEAAMVALGGPPGRVVKRLDTGESYAHNGGTTGTAADWTLIGTTMLSGDLAAIEALTGAGIAARTATDTWALRTLTAPAAGFTITNPAGTAGNPTFVLSDDLGALEALSGTNTIYYRSAANTWTAVTVGAGLGFSAGTLDRAALTGDVTASAGSNATTLATVNANVGSFGSATQSIQATFNAKGLATAVANVTITPAVGSITGLGTGVATALAVNVGSAGAFVTFNGALGTPSSGTLTSATGLPLSTGITGFGTNVATALAVNIGSIGAVVIQGDTTTTLGTTGADSRNVVTVRGTARAVRLGSTATAATIGGVDQTGTGSHQPLEISGSTVTIQASLSNILSLNSTGIDVTGLVRCDTFRIDQTPAAATPTPTHTFTISLNGTTYRVPCVV